MAVALRLARQGAKKRPFYRIVATDKRSARDGRFLEQIGFFDPRTKDFRIDRVRYDHWVANGALPSETLAHLVKRSPKAS